MAELPFPNSVVLGTSVKISESQFSGKCIYLTKEPFHNSEPLLDRIDVFHFLRTFDDSNFQFTKSRMRKKKIQSVDFEYEMIISSGNEQLFRIRHEKTGTFFAVQILCNHDSLQFTEATYKLFTRTKSFFIYSNDYVIPIPTRDDPST